MQWQRGGGGGGGSECRVARWAPALPDQLMNGAERSLVTVGFSWTLAKGFLQRKRKAEFSWRGGGSRDCGDRAPAQRVATQRDPQKAFAVESRWFCSR